MPLSSIRNSYIVNVYTLRQKLKLYDYKVNNFTTIIPRTIKKRPRKRRKISIMVGCTYETKKRVECYKMLNSTKKLV